MTNHKGLDQTGTGLITSDISGLSRSHECSSAMYWCKNWLSRIMV